MPMSNQRFHFKELGTHLAISGHFNKWYPLRCPSEIPVEL